MAKALKPDLDEATLQIAQRMLNTPPKPHDEMKVGKLKGSKLSATKTKSKEPRRTAKPR
jgi:hypothetical protein